jgi:hypothetical protein
MSFCMGLLQIEKFIVMLYGSFSIVNFMDGCILLNLFRGCYVFL